MHISLDAALQRQPLLSTVGDKLLPKFPGAAAAYSLRALNGDANDVLRVRRSGDADGTTNERDFTAEGVALELEDWVNGKLETTLPADSSFGGAAAAYSLRKVRTAYSGDAVQIRRASDNVEVNVAFDSNGEVSTSSAISNVDESPDQGETTATTLGEFLTEGGNQDATVATWYDQSGNGYDATQLSTGEQPLIAENGSLLADGINFESGVSLPLSGDGLDIFRDVAYGQIFSVIKPRETGTGNDRYFEATVGTGSGARFLFGDGQDVAATFRIGGRSLDGDSFGDEESPTSHNNELSLITGFLNYTDAEGFLFLNGTQVATNNIPNMTAGNTSDTSSQDVVIGSITASSTAEFNAKEFIIYTSDQSDNRFKIESNINNYYGIYTAAEDGFVETWYDQSGNNNHAVQDAVAGYQPKIVSAGSYLGELNFDGVDDVLIGSHNITSDYSFFTVTNDTGSSTSYIADTGTTSGNGVNYGRTVNSSGNRQLTLNHGGFGSVNASGFLVGESLISQTYDSTTISTSVNGASVGTSNQGYTASGTTLTVGASASFGAPFNGTIKEVIIYSSDQSANRTAIESNIADEYGITLP